MSVTILKRASLFGFDSNSKTVKGQKLGFLTAILYLAPSKESGKINTCQFASLGCAAACLFTAGRGGFNSVKRARIQKTLEFADNPKNFIERLSVDILKAYNKAVKKGFILCVRLNGTSDLPFENLGGDIKRCLMHRFPLVQFYDYTKNPVKAIEYAQGKLPKNYHVTFSKSESNLEACKIVLAAGGSVAVVFSGKNLPKKYLGFPVVNGDETDLRFLDKKNVIVGLFAKGKAKKDQSGFVVQVK
jgi:hypothetical protein